MLDLNIDIVILSTYDADGSGIFARQLLQSVKSLGYTARMVTVRKTSTDSDVKGIYARHSVKGFSYSVKSRLSKSLLRAKTEYAFLETCSINPTDALVENILPHKCQLIVSTFLSGMFTPESFAEIQRKLGGPPVIFYGVDMNLFTGGCHYAKSCSQYMSDCSECPAVFPLAKAFVKKNFQKKLDMVNSLISHSVVASSDEHRRQLTASRIFGESDIQEILMWVSDEIYGAHESSRQKLKADFGFGRRTLLVRSSSEPRKGSGLFVEAIRLLNEKNEGLLSSLDIVAVGDHYIFDLLTPLGIKVTSLGYVGNDVELPRLYTASDFFINTSFLDGGPMMLSQSLMSYTPVITTDVGLARNLVVPGVTGVILERMTPSNLASVILDYCRKPDVELNVMRFAARELAVKLLSKDLYMFKLSNLINSLLGFK